ncbi:hypothetical protein Btru_051147 [Bulinus truncatus]|nr:hypothetical protein Btru_051147 [Bulinus truncatus]
MKLRFYFVIWGITAVNHPTSRAVPFISRILLSEMASEVSLHLTNENIKIETKNSEDYLYHVNYKKTERQIKHEIDDIKEYNNVPSWLNDQETSGRYSTSTKVNTDSEAEESKPALNSYGSSITAPLMLPYAPDSVCSFEKVSQDRAKHKFHICEFCDKIFITKCGLKKHLFQHTLGKCFKCDTCNKAYSGMTTLKNHLQQHNMTELKPYRCAMCNKAFRDKKVVKSHLFLHILDSPYKCHVCSKTFCSTISLRNHHLQVHNKEKPFKCGICGFAFMQKSKLARHLLVHSLEKPHKLIVLTIAFVIKLNMGWSDIEDSLNYSSPGPHY